MKKTSVYLSRDEEARLEQLARLEGTSKADVIRKAIRSYVPEQGGGRDFVSAAVADGPGDSVADIPEEELLKGFGKR